MSTLHQYKWQNLTHCQQRLHYLAADDALLIYGTFNRSAQQQLMAQHDILSARCFWLTNKPSRDDDIAHVNYQQWLTLIAEHDKTHTWK